MPTEVLSEYQKTVREILDFCAGRMSPTDYAGLEKLVSILNTAHQEEQDRTAENTRYAEDSRMSGGSVAAFRAWQRAVEATRPVLGERAMAKDSAAEVYGSALAELGVDVAGVPSSAFQKLFDTASHLIPGRRGVRPARSPSAEAAFTRRFPEASSVRVRNVR